MDIEEPKIKDFKIIKKELEKEMIKGILRYAKFGEFPNNSPNSYMNAYTLVLNYSDCGDSQSEELFNHYSKIIDNFIKECTRKVKKLSNMELIDEFIRCTENINFLIYWMNRIFFYLDRFYTMNKKNTTLCKYTLESYKENFFKPLEEKIEKEVNKLIKEDRNCNIESRPKIKIILKIIDELGFCNPKIIKENNKICWINENKEDMESQQDDELAKKWFDNYFRSETAKFVEDKANKDINSMSAPEYISAQLKYLKEEDIRKEEYINPIFYSEINYINYKHLITNKVSELEKMDTGFSYMFATKRNDELIKAYQLIKLDNISYKHIINAFKPYIKKRGEEISENKEISRDPKRFIPELIKLKKEMDDLVENCFDSNNIFQDEKIKAFSNFMNKDFYAKQLSNYTDFCMKIGFKGKSNEEIENILNEIIGLFKCLNTKLVFSLDANAKMSDRLIKNKTISTNNEKKFISKLKQEQGVNYVSKMTQMMSDLDKNKNEIDDYKALPHRGRPNDIKFNIQVISQSVWEINKKAMEKIIIPKFLQICVEDFEHFYKSRYSSHNLIWCFGLSKLDIEYLCFEDKNKNNNKIKIISTSTLPQFLALLQLEKYEKLTLSKISELLGCHISTILTDISGLVYNPSVNPQGLKDKGLILGTFDENTKVFKETDEIYFNKNFIYVRQQFNTLPLLIKKSAAEEKETEIQEAQINKRYQENILQATLTRIMKSRIGQKTTHVWLVNEASKQIDLFKAQPQQIKENIEKLIEKNIMKRAEKDRTCYEYIA